MRFVVHNNDICSIQIFPGCDHKFALVYITNLYIIRLGYFIDPCHHFGTSSRNDVWERSLLRVKMSRARNLVLRLSELASPYASLPRLLRRDGCQARREMQRCRTCSLHFETALTLEHIHGVVFIKSVYKVRKLNLAIKIPS